MYQDQDLRPRWQQLLTTEWRLFRAFRVTVNLRWTIVLWPLILSFSFADYLPIGEAIGWGVAWTLAMLVFTYTHEMGHILAGRRLGVETQRITLHALGGLAHLDSGAPNPKGELFIALAGPVTHIPWWFLLLAVAWIAEAAGGSGTWLYMLQAMAALQLTVLIFNLLPFYPLDGGRCLRALLAMRMHPNRASLYVADVGFAGAVIFILVGLTSWLAKVEAFYFGEWGLILVLIGIEGFQSCRRLKMQARWTEGPYEQVEEWKKGVADPIELAMAESRELRRQAEKTDSKRGGSRRAKAATDKNKARAAPPRVDHAARMDELLDRINEVGGIEQLSKAERKELEELSRKLSE